MALKLDESFLQKVTMGTIGTAGVAIDLIHCGHDIVELERSATWNKIWSTKVKRLRVPDLLCARCGVRVESRAKSKLAITLSDSPTKAGREWHAGLGDDDLVALVKVVPVGDGWIASSRVEYFAVGDLRATECLSKLGPAKSAGEGAERDRTWPSSGSSYSGKIEAVDGTHVTIRRSDTGTTRRIPVAHPHVYVQPGDNVEGASWLVSGSVLKPLTVECPGANWSALSDLGHTDSGKRYAAVKALGLRRDPAQALSALEAVWRNNEEDSRIRLEALGGLARHLPARYVPDLGDEAIRDPTSPMAMEAVIILSELRTAEAVTQLRQILGCRELPEELRAAAGWGLGIGGHERPEDLMDFIGDPSDEVAIHAIIAMGNDLSDDVLNRVADLLGKDERTAEAVANTIARQGVRGADLLLCRIEALENENELVRTWILVGLGLLGRLVVLEAARGDLSSALGRELAPLWAGLSEGWLAGGNRSRLGFVSRQTFRVELAESADWSSFS